MIDELNDHRVYFYWERSMSALVRIFALPFFLLRVRFSLLSQKKG